MLRLAVRISIACMMLIGLIICLCSRTAFEIIIVMLCLIPYINFLHLYESKRTHTLISHLAFYSSACIILILLLLLTGSVDYILYFDKATSIVLFLIPVSVSVSISLTIALWFGMICNYIVSAVASAAVLFLSLYSLVYMIGLTAWSPADFFHSIGSTLYATWLITSTMIYNSIICYLSVMHQALQAKRTVY